MRRQIQLAAAAALFVAVTMTAPARADEFKLKDGSKVVGTIVGFDDNSFKVKTSYGFAIVQKDQVVSISISGEAKKPEAEKKKSEPAVEKAPAPPKPTKTETASATPLPAMANPVKSDAPTESALAANKTPASETKPAAPATKAAPSATTAKNAAPPAPVTSPPPKPAAPEPMKEEVSGNLYTNVTYGFHMYKPPDWSVIDGARTVLPGVITAMGTSDERTYLLIGQEPAGKSLASDMDMTEHRLREMLDNYRPLGEKRVLVSGVPAIEHRFRGSVDKHDWSGIVVFIPRDTHLYTIFGMTYADNDLVQIQENVISRAITSLQFTKQ